MSHTIRVALLCAFVACSFVSGARCQRDLLEKLPRHADVAAVDLPEVPGGFEPFAVPGEGIVRGLAGFDGEVWIARGDELIAVSLDGRVRKRVSAPDGLLGLTADERFAYVLRRRSVEVLDKLAMVAVRSLPVTHEDGDEVPVAVGAHAGELFVLWPDRIAAVDARTDAARALRIPAPRMTWLASDGKRLFGGGPGGFGVIDAREAIGDEPQPRIATTMSSLGPGYLGAFVGGRVLLVRQQRRRNAGGVLAVSAGFVAPGVLFVRERLTIGVFAGEQGARYEVGPKPLRSLERLRQELQRLVASPSIMVPTPGGGRAVMPVVLEAHAGTKVRDLLALYDAVVAAGFPSVQCVRASERAPWRALIEEPPPPPPPPPGKRNAGK